MGGMVKAIEQGYVQQEIANAAYRYQQGVENGSIPIIGINQNVENESDDIPTLQIDDTIRQVQTEKLSQLKAERDDVKVQNLIQQINRNAKEKISFNLIKPISSN